MRIVRLASTPSTNDDAFGHLTRGDSCAVWTLDQTAGRGSRGRVWLGPKNRVLALSLGLGPGAGPHPAEFCYPLFAGLLLIDTLRALAPGGDFALKWPNDLLLSGAKAAGILCESRIMGDQPSVVIGIGLNLHRDPSLESLPKGYAALDQLGDPPAPETIVSGLIARLQTTMAATANPQTLNALWLERHFIQPGAMVRLQAYGEIFEGVFNGLSREGGFQVRDASGLIKTVRAACDDFQLSRPS